MSDRQEWIDGLRAIADWFEVHPEYSCDSTLDASVWFFPWQVNDPKAELVAFVRVLGGHVTKDGGTGHFEVAKEFGPHKISGNTSREAVCEKVVTTVVEEVTEPDPELVAAVPTITHKVEREEIEWVCPPSLLSS